MPNNHNSSTSISSRLLNAFFLAGAVLPLPSIFLYVFLSTGTVEYFNGTPSATAAFWCSTNAAADATIAFLCWNALLTTRVEIKVLVLRAFAIYAVFHWGAFWYWSDHGDNPHPALLLSVYPFAILTSLVACLWWGFLHPPQPTAALSRHEQPYETLHNATWQTINNKHNEEEEISPLMT
jgi:hypothetical protein